MSPQIAQTCWHALADSTAVQSFWTFSRDKKGYSGRSSLFQPWSNSCVSLELEAAHKVIHTSYVYGAGVATYVARHFSPLDAHVDCLGDGDKDVDREGR